jgi:hypothetical protein
MLMDTFSLVTDDEANSNTTSNDRGLAFGTQLSLVISYIATAKLTIFTLPSRLPEPDRQRLRVPAKDVGEQRQLHLRQERLHARPRPDHRPGRQRRGAQRVRHRRPRREPRPRRARVHHLPRRRVLLLALDQRAFRPDRRVSEDRFTYSTFLHLSLICSIVFGTVPIVVLICLLLDILSTKQWTLYIISFSRSDSRAR